MVGSPARKIPPSSSRIGAMRSSLLDAAEIRREFLFSDSLSFRLRSLRRAFLSSFSNSKVHHPAKASHFWAKTLSITASMSTPAARIRSRQSFSKTVAKGGGWCNLRIACCWGACSARNGWERISGNVGRRRGRLERRTLSNDTASGGKCSGYFGSSIKIFVLVTLSSSSSKGSSPQSRAYRMMPKLHTSTFSPAYFSPFSISGAE